MRWARLSSNCKLYICCVCLLSFPAAASSLLYPFSFSGQWLVLTIASIFVSTINVRLPKTSSVISMGDVFTILALLHFGAAPALLTYWTDIISAHLADQLRRHGRNFIREVLMYRVLFNLASCAISVAGMAATVSAVSHLGLPSAVVFGVTLLSMAFVWFLLNTIAVAIAISLWTGKSIYGVWREGLGVCLLNFIGSASAAGLISLFYERVGFNVFLLTLPIAAVIYQLHRFYIDRFEQAQSHISELNELYLSTIEALSSAVDAKDRYTHGHIRRVQAYATELARCLNVTDEKELMGIKAGALLHDIGKLAVPEYILNKPTVLTEAEYEKMKIHPVIGANMLKGIKFPFPVEPMVRFHHERWDGRGYPAGLSADQIPLAARILALVDCYDALTTDRPYRSPMTREKVIEFFRKESGTAYDPAVVEAFLANIIQIEEAGAAVRSTPVQLSTESTTESKNSVRRLEQVQPTLNYSQALSTSVEIQRQLYSIFDFVRADMKCLAQGDVLKFMASKLARIAEFDAAAFFIADPERGELVAKCIEGTSGLELDGLSIRMEQKLSGWAAANNQSLLNLPPFPDFAQVGGRPFQMSAIAPMHKNGIVWGAVSVYRKDPVKFSNEEFRRIEIVATQTAIALSNVSPENDSSPALFDNLTGLPNGYQLYLMFDQLATDAERYDYPLSILSMTVENIAAIRSRFGYASGEDAIRTLVGWIASEIRQTDLLVRYASDLLIAVTPKISLEQAEALKSRIQDKVYTSRLAVRADNNVQIKVSVGTASYPTDSKQLDELLRIADWRLREDRSLAEAVELQLQRQKS